VVPRPDDAVKAVERAGGSAPFRGDRETPMSDTPLDRSEELENLEEDAEALEERARRDGVLPPEDQDEDGVGPQTGVVP
jgi:hypothetical protein